MASITFTPTERRYTIAGVMVVFLLSALDQTIIATAMPRIVAELNGLALYAWVTTAYLLTSTVAVPIAGKLGDLYGRKPVLVASITIFLIGSCLAGLAGEFGPLPVLGDAMTQLIVFRAVQGIGGGALFTAAYAIVADIYPPRERAKIAGLFGAVFGISSAVGPLIGGWFTDHGTVTLFGWVIAGWRWVFYINLPLGAVSLFIILVEMPKMSHAARGKVDYLGALLIVGAIVPLLLALTFGGHTRPWGSVEVLSLFAVSAVATVLYVIAERSAADPIVPVALFANRTFTYGNIASFLIFMAFMAMLTYLPLFIQTGQGVSPMLGGLAMLPMTFGLMVGSMGAGRLVARRGIYKPHMLIGLLIMAGATFLLASMQIGTSLWDVAWRIFLFGVGMGPGMSVYSIVVQSAAPADQVGVATSAGQFFRQIGSTVGVAVFGTILTNDLNARLADTMPGVNVSTLQTLGDGAAVLPEAVRAMIVSSLTTVFLLTIVVLAVAFVATLLMPHVALRGRGPAADGAVTAPAPAQ